MELSLQSWIFCRYLALWWPIHCHITVNTSTLFLWIPFMHFGVITLMRFIQTDENMGGKPQNIMQGQTHRWQFLPLLKVWNVKSFYDSWWTGKPGKGQNYDMQLKVLSLCILAINTKYINGYWFINICLSNWWQWEKWTLIHKIQTQWSYFWYAL